ncbi:DUF2490 domain-containing protein [Parvicella tangerina]|uniref:DUF2490 domain-containing protein n=1 Tax=Parvicella tangerina TaxID=2829795 RepID=A0A916JM05_9FLAO|nr:DUF2490 domain-containing protein [Parvicella tangerina]CAG5080660.1 hypothetical protein CRYO30217_01411 [Parvicella tangerina]
MSTKKQITILLFFLSCSFVKGQTNFRFGLLPNCNLNYSITDDWQLNFKLESRAILYQNNWDFNYRLTDASFLITKRIGAFSKVNFGYLHRFTGGSFVNRTIQQLTIVTPLTQTRLAHRFALDQTFGSNSPLVFRLRYRAGLEFSLQGEEINNHEGYFKITSEVLNHFSVQPYLLEIRLTPSLGYLISAHHKVELGLDYRLADLINNSPKHDLWTCIRWYIKV